MQRQHHSKSLQEYYYRQRKHSVIYTGGLTHTQEHTGHKFRQTGTPVVDSHMVSDKSPMAYLRVQMAPPICLFNTKGMRRMKCANSPPPLLNATLAASQMSGTSFIKPLALAGNYTSMTGIFVKTCDNDSTSRKMIQTSSIIGINCRGPRHWLSACLSCCGAFFLGLRN